MSVAFACVPASPGTWQFCLSLHGSPCGVGHRSFCCLCIVFLGCGSSVPYMHSFMVSFQVCVILGRGSSDPRMHCFFRHASSRMVNGQSLQSMCLHICSFDYSTFARTDGLRGSRPPFAAVACSYRPAMMRRLEQGLRAVAMRSRFSD